MTTVTTADPLVELRGVGKSFITKSNQVVQALHDVSLSIGQGEFVAIVGPSGCGKSTTLNLLAGLEPLTEGTALIGGKPPGEIQYDVGYVFQQDSVLPWRRVLENVELGLELRKVPPAERRGKAEALVRLMGLEGFGHSYPVELSGGMRKRVALAMTLAYDPTVLLMDEPFGALDAQTRAIMQDELLRIWGERRQTVLFVTHDIGEAIAVADRVVVMTARPARIKSIYEVDLPRPRSAGDARFDPRFDVLYKKIWEDLKPEIAEQSRIGGMA
jgi:NitT/TauT family transport system ATP-binding protein